MAVKVQFKFVYSLKALLNFELSSANKFCEEQCNNQFKTTPRPLKSYN